MNRVIFYKNVKKSSSSFFKFFHHPYVIFCCILEDKRRLQKSNVLFRRHVRNQPLFPINVSTKLENKHLFPLLSLKFCHTAVERTATEVCCGFSTQLFSFKISLDQPDSLAIDRLSRAIPTCEQNMLLFLELLGYK